MGAHFARLAKAARCGTAFLELISVVSFSVMSFPVKICSVCGEEFELKPDKPGFANRCPECSVPEAAVPTNQRRMDADERKNMSEANAARRQAMRELLYRKDS